MLYHKLHWGPQGWGQNFYWGRAPWSPFEPPLDQALLDIIHEQNSYSQ